jgi:hypothetical protein
MPPTLGHGKICYLVIPAVDVATSAHFYSKIFGWNTRIRGDGQMAFDDGVGEVSGAWVSGRPPVDAGALIYIMTADIHRTCQAVIDAGGDIIQPVDPAAREITAQFRDPAGNAFGLYQERGLEHES